MIRPQAPQILPAILGSLRQERAEGTLTLEQNDGTRRLHWSGGEIVYLQSDVAGEQFGNYLLRQGILDFPALSELLANEERFRLGEKVVQWGLMSVEERDVHLRLLQEQIMIHALEHPIIEMDWNAGTTRSQLSQDLQFKLDHRQFVWSTFHEAHNLGELCDLLYAESRWRWVAPADLLGSLGDLPLTPQVAYALSFWGPEPIGYETFLSLSGMNEEEGARLLVTVWALGGLSLAQGEVHGIKAALPEPPEQAPPAPAAQVPAPPVSSVPPMPIPPAEPFAAAMPAPEPPRIELDFLPHDESSSTPEPSPFETLVPSGAEPTQKLAEDRPDDEPPHLRARKYLLKAKNLLVQDRTAEAIRLLEQAVKIDPDSEIAYEPWLLLGKHRLSNPAWSNRAIEALQAASRLRPKSAEPWAIMGEIYHRKNFQANARACYRKALDLDPSIPVPPDLDLKDEPAAPEERAASSLLNKFKALLGHNPKD